MEDRNFDPNETDGQAPVEASEPKRAGESLLQYFLRKREAPAETKEEEEGIESPNKKRWRIFKGFFSSIVPSPTEIDSPKIAEKEDSLPLGWQSIQSTEYAIQEPEVDLPISTATLNTAEQIAPKPASPESPEPGVPQNRQLEPEEHTVELAQAESRIDSQSNLFPSVATEREMPQDISIKRAEKETVIERGSGNALPVLLVGAEYLGRKRADRKLDKKIDATVDTLQKHTTAEVFNQQKLENLVRQNREQIEKLKVERGIASPERPRAENTQRHPRSEIYTPKIEEAPKSIFAEQKQSRPEQITSQKPQEALETQSRLERVIERSHEVKDDQTNPGAVSVGSIVNNQASYRLGRPPSSSPIKIDDSQGLPVVADSPDSDAYKQAMKLGFWTAVIIIVFGLLAYLMLK